MFCIFFFFQAEDGIRDKLVTGVQTCALPISPSRRRGRDASRRPGQHARCATPPVPAREERSRAPPHAALGAVPPRRPLSAASRELTQQSLVDALAAAGRAADDGFTLLARRLDGEPG